MAYVKTRKVKIWTLDDGSKVTTKDVMKTLSCPYPTAFSRLVRSTDPKKIYKPKQDTSGGKTYTLDDGSVWTVSELAKHLGCLNSTAGVRLSQCRVKGNSAKRVLAPVNSKYSKGEIRKRVNKKIQAEHNRRMVSDPDGFWKIFNAYT